MRNRREYPRQLVRRNQVRARRYLKSIRSRKSPVPEILTPTRPKGKPGGAEKDAPQEKKWTRTGRPEEPIVFPDPNEEEDEDFENWN